MYMNNIIENPSYISHDVRGNAQQAGQVGNEYDLESFFGEILYPSEQSPVLILRDLPNHVPQVQLNQVGITFEYATDAWDAFQQLQKLLESQSGIPEKEMIDTILETYEGSKISPPQVNLETSQ